MEAELKPCPFCGSEYPHSMRGDNNLFVIVCDMCQSRTYQFVLRQDAVEMWNTRREKK
jgi:Lar family restriction alleviation protein